MFRFSIRDALLAVPLLAIGFAWVCDRGRLEATQEQVAKLRAELQEQDFNSLVREAKLKLELSPNDSFPVWRCGIGTFSVDSKAVEPGGCFSN
jgi:hypothetical protein